MPWSKVSLRERKRKKLYLCLKPVLSKPISQIKIPICSQSSILSRFLTFNEISNKKYWISLRFVWCTARRSFFVSLHFSSFSPLFSTPKDQKSINCTLVHNRGLHRSAKLPRETLESLDVTAVGKRYPWCLLSTCPRRAVLPSVVIGNQLALPARMKRKLNLQ